MQARINLKQVAERFKNSAAKFSAGLRGLRDRYLARAKRPKKGLSLIALDIGPQEIRVIQADIQGSIPTPKDAISGGVIVDTAKVAAAIRELLISKGISGKNVVCALSGNKVILHLTNVPILGSEGIKDILKDEASKYIVFAGSQILTDFYPIEEISEEGSKRLRVLSVAASQEIVNSYVETIKSAGLYLQAIDAACLSLVRAICSKQPISGGVLVLAAVEYDSAVIFIFKDGKIHYLHNVDSISELSQLNPEIESILGYCRSEFGEAVELTKVVSTDIKGASVAEGLALRAQEEFDFPININLLPVEELRIKEFKNQVFVFAKVLACLAICLVLMFFSLRLQAWFMRRRAIVIQQELEKPNPTLDKLMDIENMSKLWDSEIKAQQGIIDKAGVQDWSKVLQEIKRIIPKNASLFSIKSDKSGNTVFRGEAFNQNSVFDFVLSLKESKFLQT